MAVKDFRLNGQNSLAYLGDNAYSPPNIKTYNRAPTTDDYKNFFVGDMWIDQSATPKNLYFLVSRENKVATWLVTTSSLSLPLSVSDGGTGRITLTDGAVLVGDGTNDVEMVGPGTNGQILVSATGASPVWANLTAGNNIGVTNAAGSLTVDVNGTTQYALQLGDATNSLDSLALGSANQVLHSNGAGANPSWSAVDLAADVTGTLTVPNGGTGVATLTANGLMYGNGVSPIVSLAEATDGQLPIGSTGNPPVLTTLTAGANINIVNAAGAITITAAGGGSGASICSFFAKADNTENNVTGDGTVYTIIFKNEYFDTGNHFNNATGAFTAPQTGLYQFNYQINFQPLGAAHTHANITINHSAGVSRHSDNIFNPYNMASPLASVVTYAGSYFTDMTIGDTLDISLQVLGGTKTISITGGTQPDAWFSGFLVA